MWIRYGSKYRSKLKLTLSKFGASVKKGSNCSKRVSRAFRCFSQLYLFKLVDLYSLPFWAEVEFYRKTVFSGTVFYRLKCDLFFLITICIVSLFWKEGYLLLDINIDFWKRVFHKSRQAAKRVDEFLNFYWSGKKSNKRKIKIRNKPVKFYMDFVKIASFKREFCEKVDFVPRHSFTTIQSEYKSFLKIFSKCRKLKYFDYLVKSIDNFLNSLFFVIVLITLSACELLASLLYIQSETKIWNWRLTQRKKAWYQTL